MTDQGPEVAEQAQGLFASEDPVLRMAGAALLGELGMLDNALITQIANESNPAHILSVLGWLQDAGRTDEAGALRNLIQQDMTKDNLAQLFTEGHLEGISGRAALDILNANLSAEDKHNLFLMIANDPVQTYDVRMKALVDLRASMDLPDYRAVVQNVRQATHGQDALWDEGMMRLDNKLQGPLELMQGPLVISAQEIDLMLAREYPRMLEDLALHLEYAVAHTDSLIGMGTSERLRERLDQLQQMPWTAEQVVSLKRLEGLTGLIQDREQEISTPPHSPPLPPGF